MISIFTERGDYMKKCLIFEVYKQEIKKSIYWMLNINMKVTITSKVLKIKQTSNKFVM